MKLSKYVFLSTPSARRATKAVSSPLLTLVDFYPRPPRGGRPTSRDVQARHLVISIHALREEGDKYGTMQTEREVNFYPRPPRGGRRGIRL